MGLLGDACEQWNLSARLQLPMSKSLRSFIDFCLFETRDHPVAKAGLELMFLMPLRSMCWDYSRVSLTCLAKSCLTSFLHTSPCPARLLSHLTASFFHSFSSTHTEGLLFCVEASPHLNSLSLWPCRPSHGKLLHHAPFHTRPLGFHKTPAEGIGSLFSNEGS